MQVKVECVTAKRGKSMLVVERGEYAGTKNMSGGRIYAHSLHKLFDKYGEGEVDWGSIPLDKGTGHLSPFRENRRVNERNEKRRQMTCPLVSRIACEATIVAKWQNPAPLMGVVCRYG